MNPQTITKEINISASPSRVFDALTNAEEIVKYFPLHEVVSDWKVGGEVIHRGEVNGSEFTDYGIIDAFSRPNIYKYTYWSTNHGTERVPENYISITYELLEEGTGTKLMLEQSNINSTDMYEMMNSVVWDVLLNELKSYVESTT